MTGFARADGGNDKAQWVVEVRSVNGKGRDMRCRLPPGLDGLEPVVRTAVEARLARGNINVTISLTRTDAAGTLRINRELLDQVLGLAREIAGPDAPPPSIDTLLSVRGIIDSTEPRETEEDRQALEQAMAVTIALAIDRLVEARIGEGSHLSAVLLDHLGEIGRLTDAAAATSSLQPEALRAKLRAQIQALLDAVPPVGEDRLAQEAALLITKADVREELDRLRAHISQARTMLRDGGSVGRRLDFLCQEFNREANTLCSKSADVELTRIGMDLKAVIEQFREQVQNIE
ncbi:YicC/YloC family endoribonuclease [Niveispirillum fermenti]|uniref:YicC/YloC family endoribonuclease n=1 Tax=Niveispirillum fermenti TaxID=1233113 RepID=UPI003A843AE2